MPEIFFSGPDGRIEGRYQRAEKKNAPAALILHPHPLHGGTMNNKVVYNLYHAFARSGFSVFRFNFRGVGRSEGVFDNGVGELNDGAAALDWMQLQNPDASSYWMGGFSFGSWIGMQLLMRRPELEGFVSVSPPAGSYDFNFLSPCPANGLIVQGNEDSVVSEEEVAKLHDKLSRQKNTNIEYQVVQGADHFFRNKIDTFSDVVTDYIKRRMEEDARRPKKIKPDRRRRQQAPIQ